MGITVNRRNSGGENSKRRIKLRFESRSAAWKNHRVRILQDVSRIPPKERLFFSFYRPLPLYIFNVYAELCSLREDEPRKIDLSLVRSLSTMDKSPFEFPNQTSWISPIYTRLFEKRNKERVRRSDHGQCHDKTILRQQRNPIEKANAGTRF